jgi:hypothetical protein
MNMTTEQIDIRVDEVVSHVFSLSGKPDVVAGYVNERKKFFTAMHRSMVDASDLDDISSVFPSSWPEYPDEIAVDTIDDLRQAFESYLWYAGAEFNDQARSHMNRSSKHEEEHAAAIQRLGIVPVRYLLRVSPTLGSCFFTTMGQPASPFPKAAYGAIAGFPIVPSSNDNRLLTEIGYTDDTDVFSRVIQLNIDHGLNIPIPDRFSTQSH